MLSRCKQCSNSSMPSVLRNRSFHLPRGIVSHHPFQETRRNDFRDRRLKHLIRQGRELVMKRRRRIILVRRPVLNLYSFLLHLHSSNRDPAYRIVIRVLTSNRNISIFALVTTKTKKVAAFVPLQKDRKSRASMP